MSVQDYLKQYFNKERMRPDSPWAFFLIRDVIDSTTEGETPEHTPIQKNPYTKPFLKSGSPAKPQPLELKQTKINRSEDYYFIKLEKAQVGSILYYYCAMR